MNMSESRRFRLTPGGQTLAPPLEARSQAAVIQWANRSVNLLPDLRLLFAVPNAARRDKGARGLLLATGMKAGVPDLILPVARDGFIGLAIEMKRKGEEPSEVQLAWLAALSDQGWLAIVCYGAIDAIEALHAYVTARPTRIA